MTDIPDEIMAKAREIAAKILEEAGLPGIADDVLAGEADKLASVKSATAALLSERTASEAALKEAREVIESLMDIKRGDEFETARAFLAKT